MKPLALLAVFAAVAIAAAAKPSPSVTRTVLQQNDLSAPGREAIQARIDFPPGAVAAPHKHPGEEIIYVLQGKLEYRLEGQAPATLKAGDVLFVPYGVVHSARNVGAGVASELATYVTEKGKPLIVPAP